MEKFRKSVKRRIILFSGVDLAAALLGVYCFFAAGSSDKSADRVLWGFQIGLISGILILFLIRIIKLSMAIKDDTGLKKLYNRENDERLRAIKSKAGMPMLMVNSVIMLISAVIAGFFNITVFFTLVIAAAVQLLIGTIVKFYYMKSM